MNNWIIGGIVACGIGATSLIVVHNTNNSSTPSIVKDQHATAITFAPDKFQRDAAELEKKMMQKINDK